ncbi:uncharacterized protein N7479_005274 [Penicillium vulpinum]|uniref:Uncharacterized protein n=1 Tax=Penicillium vulpinum TaxID=29845 RepID=A0A1V6RHJ6_9EURO|nr:uncharacterized protein N7479_005274 [Penicillium vulpinum]KAJ5958124.1 hypothetical protein N7479_005274 [Penicillium vulpinum]OQE01282.1 hypothetical protein PENVUL_c043G04333 [Penicillium vulpinum]
MATYANLLDTTTITGNEREFLTSLLAQSGINHQDPILAPERSAGSSTIATRPHTSTTTPRRTADKGTQLPWNINDYEILLFKALFNISVTGDGPRQSTG